MSSPLDEKTLCCDCRWWVKDEEKPHEGECRFEAPRVLPDSTHTSKTNWAGSTLDMQHLYCTAWPDTQWDEFCGRFRARVKGGNP